jgi:hypothetical protein
MRTHESNVGSVIADVGMITLESLKKYNIPYDEIHFGKPYANFYIDDLAINPKKSLEKQLGFYKTVIKPRYFHDLKIDGNLVIKKGNLAGESFWYKNVPKEIKKFLPKIIDNTESEIKMERINGVPFSFLYVNNSLTTYNLEQLLETIEKIHIPSKNTEIYKNYKFKLLKRFHQYDYSKFSDSASVYKNIYKRLDHYEEKNLGNSCIVHGDPVFTNIILDVGGNIKLIDPRGKQGPKNSIYGDKFYDYSKIYQSLLGYDFILLEKEKNERYVSEMLKHFENYVISRWGEDRLSYIKTISESLLFSLIPLHDDEKCQKYYDLISKINTE